jgi:hypothetical protein
MSYSRTLLGPGPPVNRQLARQGWEEYHKKYETDREVAERSLSRYAVNNSIYQQVVNVERPSASLCTHCQEGFRRNDLKKSIQTLISLHRRQSFNIFYRAFVWSEVKDAAEHGCLICAGIVAKLDQVSGALGGELREVVHHFIAFEIPYKLYPLKWLSFASAASAIEKKLMPDYYTKFFSSIMFFRFLKVRGPFVVEVALIPKKRYVDPLVVTAFELRLSSGMVQPLLPLTLTTYSIRQAADLRPTRCRSFEPHR